MGKKLQAKDLITIGIFTAIYFILFFATGMIGIIPIFMVFLPLLVPITTGIPFMLFLTKTDKFGMVTIMSIIVGLLMFLVGHTWVVLVTALVCGLIADLIFKSGNYKSGKLSIIGFAVFSLWSIGAMTPFWFAKESYLAQIEKGYGTEYVKTVSAMTPNWVLPALIVGAFIFGILGGLLGKSVLKKHFKKAGIV